MNKAKELDTQSTRLVTCPACGGESVYGNTNPHRPFCSHRCRDIDLGNWANEDFRVKVEPEADADSLGLPSTQQ
ncbi:MAG: DNA gyrase inhibitor YacG [Rhodoferax sp.]|nr:DNA gyrase inhibitor YacG [Rhodoferax sp.]